MPHRHASTALYCQAKHPDPHKRFALCYSLLGYFPAVRYEFVATADRAPDTPVPEDRPLVWVRCPRNNCRCWNSFRVLPPAEELEDDADVRRLHIVEP